MHKMVFARWDCIWILCSSSKGARSLEMVVGSCVADGLMVVGLIGVLAHLKSVVELWDGLVWALAGE